MTAEERALFDEILEKALVALPPEVRRLLEEVPILVEDEPSEEVLADMGLESTRRGESDLCGLYWEHGVEGIFLFRGPILRISEGEESELHNQIRVTLLHELGHHFGWDDETLEKMGYG